MSTKSPTITTQDQPFEARRARGKFKLNSDELQHITRSLDQASRTAKTAQNIFQTYSVLKHATNLIERIASQHDFTASQLAEWDRTTGLITVVESARTGPTRAELKSRKKLKKDLKEQTKRKK